MAAANRVASELGSRVGRPFRHAYRFLQDVWHELQRVVWPSKEEAYAFTMVVVIAVLVVAAYMGTLDLLTTYITRDLLKMY